jgi:hypothetical protein
MRRSLPRLAIACLPAVAVMFFEQQVSVVRASEAVAFVAVCVGQDRVLHANPFNAPCPPGTTRLVLSGADEPNFTNCPFCKPKPFEPPDFSRQLNDLERRISELEQKHPLMEVVDSQKRTIFRVSPRQAAIVNEGGPVVAAMAATEGGGMFTAQTLDRSLIISLGISGANTGVEIKQGGTARLALGTTGKLTNYSLRVLGADGVIAGIGESKAGTGIMSVGDAMGHTRASMMLAGGKAAVAIYNSGSTGILSLTQSESGAGLLAIGDAKGDPMVKMGVNGTYGVVLTGPKAGLPYVPSSGLPGSYLLGCAASGADCHPWH